MHSGLVPSKIWPCLAPISLPTELHETDICFAFTSHGSVGPSCVYSRGIGAIQTRDDNRDGKEGVGEGEELKRENNNGGADNCLLEKHVKGRARAARKRPKRVIFVGAWSAVLVADKQTKKIKIKMKKVTRFLRLTGLDSRAGEGGQDKSAFWQQHVLGDNARSPDGTYTLLIPEGAGWRKSEWRRVQKCCPCRRLVRWGHQGSWQSYRSRPWCRQRRWPE